MMEIQDKPVYWDVTGQVCFIGGKGFGLTPELRSIVMGDETSINEYLHAAGPLPEGISTAAVECLESIKLMIGVNKNDRPTDNKPIRASGFSKRRHKRDRLAKGSKHRVGDFIRVEVGEKLPNDKVKSR